MGPGGGSGGLGGGGLGGGAAATPGDVVPNAALAEVCRSLKWLFVAEGIVLLPILFTGRLWTLIQGITIAAGYFAIRDPLVFRGQLMQLYFVFTVFGAVFAAVDLAVAAANLLQGAPGVPPAAVGVVAGEWVFATVVLVAAAVFAWRACTASWACVPAAGRGLGIATPLGFRGASDLAGRRPDYPNAGGYGFGTGGDGGSATGTGRNQQSTAVFAGEGRRLGAA